MRKMLYAAVAVIGVYGYGNAMHLDGRQSVDFSTIKTRDIPEDAGTTTHTGFMQGSMFVFTCAIDLNKLCDDVIAILSDESKYSPDVNELLRNEKLLKCDDFPRSLNFISFLLPFVPLEKRTTISTLVPQVEGFIRIQYTALNTEYSGFIKPEELFAVDCFFLQRLQALQDFSK